MRDPFPLPNPNFLKNLVIPVANYLSLPTLPLHAHEVLFAIGFYHFVYLVVSPYLSARLFPNVYRDLNSRSRVNWGVHMVSLLQSVLIVGLSLWICLADDERTTSTLQQRILGYTGAGGFVQAFGLGYFLWDFYISLKHIDIFQMGFVLHALCASLVFGLGFRPFANFYSPVFLLYELSSPFLNIHWYCDKAHMSGSTLQKYNGVILIITFFFARLVWGPYQSVSMFSDIWRVWQDPQLGSQQELQTSQDFGQYNKSIIIPSSVPTWLLVSFLGSNLTLTTLNVVWFVKMILSAKKRLGADPAAVEASKAIMKEGLDSCIDTDDSTEEEEDEDENEDEEDEDKDDDEYGDDEDEDDEYDEDEKEKKVEKINIKKKIGVKDYLLS